jgi:vacuolar-type H+-ATPase subunit I/STV1
LLTWRQRVESLAWQGAPTRLDRNDERAVHRHHARLDDQLHKERDRLERKLAKQLTAVHDKAARQTTRLAEEEAKLEDRHRRQVAEIRKRQRERTTVLLAERNEIDRQAETFLAEIEQMGSGLARRQQQLDAEQSALNALLAQREMLHFRTYLRRVFWPR